MNEYELAGIETIARGVCLREGRLLLCRAKGGATTYLPGGHIEFGETGRQALVREVKEELGLDAQTGKFLGVVENAFTQHGKPHAEINLVYALEIPSIAPGKAVPSCEEWIAFDWAPVADLASSAVEPAVLRTRALDWFANRDVAADRLAVTPMP